MKNLVKKIDGILSKKYDITSINIEQCFDREHIKSGVISRIHLVVFYNDNKNNWTNFSLNCYGFEMETGNWQDILIEKANKIINGKHPYEL